MRNSFLLVLESEFISKYEILGENFFDDVIYIDVINIGVASIAESLSVSL